MKVCVKHVRTKCIERGHFTNLTKKLGHQKLPFKEGHEDMSRRKRTLGHPTIIKPDTRT
jgi:hypothetical protein